MGSKKHVTCANQNPAELTDSTQGVNKKKKKKLGHQEKPKEQCYLPKMNTTEPPPVAVEKPKDNTGKITQKRKAQEKVTQH